MATKNRRVAAYLPLEVDKAFIEFKIERGLATEESPNRSDSQALIQLMSEFLGVGHSVAYSSESDVLQRLSGLEKEVAHLKTQVDENQRITKGMKDEVISELTSELPSSVPDQMNLLETQSADQGFTPSVDSVPQDLLDGLSAVNLSKRFKADRGTLTKYRRMGEKHFLVWSQDKDPDGLAWEFRDSKYYPVTEDGPL